ncbi:unnamed protein product, partial [Candidula unifasciata]
SENLRSEVQPASKLCRHEPQPGSSQTKDLPAMIDVRRKESSKAVNQRIQKLETPGSPEIVQNQGLGIVIKGSAATTQAGGILLPTKFANQHWMISSQMNPQLQQRGQKLLPAGSEGNPNDQDSREYQDLVRSFNVKTQVRKNCMPEQQTGLFASGQQRDLQKASVLPVSTGNSQRMLLPNQRVYQPASAHLGPVSEGHMAAGPLFGLSGVRLSEVAERFPPGASGNIPHMDILMQSGEETYRPKLKGRRGHGSQDEK